MIRNTIRNTIQNTIRNTLGDDAFNMLDLFSGGQRGVWYDPSDLATMFQESTGTTAVTADGQPVGLMLDKSRGDVLGDELVANGTFDTDVSDWLLYGDSASTFTYSSGRVLITAATSGDGIYRGMSTVIGKTYFVTASYEVGTASEVLITSNASGSGSATGTTSGSLSYLFTASGTTTFIRFITGNTSTGTAYFDNISVKEVLGIPAQQPISTQRPTYNSTPDRLTLDLVDDSLSFTVPTGGIDGYMVVGTNDGTASYGVSLPAGSYELGGDYFPSNTINGFLLREGAVSKSDLSKVEKDFVSKGAKESYGDVTDFTAYWREKNITDFPLIDTSSGTSFQGAWRNNNLTSFPLIDTSSGTTFYFAWLNNSTLADFPANMFDNCPCTNFTSAFTNTGLTQESIDNILVSINSNGTSNGTFSQSGGSAPSAAGEAAIDGLVTRGWTVNVTGGYQGKVLPQALFENDESGFWYNMGIN